MPEILEATHGYLCQLADIDDDKDRIEVSSMLIQAMRTAAIEAKKELESKLV